MKVSVKVPLFNICVEIYVGDTMKSRFFRDSGAEEPTEVFGACGNGSRIWLSEVLPRYLAHEASHCADNICNHVGVDDQNGEVKAYIIGEIVGKAWPKLTKAA